MYGKPVTLPGIAMVWGLTIMVMIYSIGQVSGAHFNPAVSIALASSRKFPFKQIYGGSLRLTARDFVWWLLCLGSAPIPASSIFPVSRQSGVAARASLFHLVSRRKWSHRLLLLGRFRRGSLRRRVPRLSGSRRIECFLPVLLLSWPLPRCAYGGSPLRVSPVFLLAFVPHCFDLALFAGQSPGSQNLYMKEERTVQKAIKEAAKRNDMVSAKALAKEIVSSRRTVNKLYENKAQMNSISMHLGESIGFAVMSRLARNRMQQPEISSITVRTQTTILNIEDGRSSGDPRSPDSPCSLICISFVQKLIGEFVGTFSLVFAGCSATVVNDTYGELVTLPGIALAWGLTVMVMSYSIGHVSGAHFNPAVSIALASSRKFPFKQVPGYIAAQLLGSTLAAEALRLMFHLNNNVCSLKGDVYVGTHPSGSNTATFVVEFIATFNLLFVI
ncbi:hypothetical protein Bca101_072298 [Brassica carinata]